MKENLRKIDRDRQGEINRQRGQGRQKERLTQTQRGKKIIPSRKEKII